MNRFNKAILFGLVTTIFGASNVSGMSGSIKPIEVGCDFSVVSNNTSGQSQSIKVDGTETKCTTTEITANAITEALKNATSESTLTYTVAYEQTVKNELSAFGTTNKANIATVYACWLIKVCEMTAKEAIEETEKLEGLAGACDREVIVAFYGDHLSKIDLIKVLKEKAPAAKKPFWTARKKLLLFAALIAGCYKINQYMTATSTEPSVCSEEYMSPLDPTSMCGLDKNATIHTPLMETISELGSGLKDSATGVFGNPLPGNEYSIVQPIGWGLSAATGLLFAAFKLMQGRI